MGQAEFVRYWLSQKSPFIALKAYKISQRIPFPPFSFHLLCLRPCDDVGAVVIGYIIIGFFHRSLSLAINSKASGTRDAWRMDKDSQSGGGKGTVERDRELLFWLFRNSFKEIISPTFPDAAATKTHAISLHISMMEQISLLSLSFVLTKTPLAEQIFSEFPGQIHWRHSHISHFLSLTLCSLPPSFRLRPKNACIAYTHTAHLAAESPAAPLAIGKGGSGARGGKIRINRETKRHSPFEKREMGRRPDPPIPWKARCISYGVSRSNSKDK